MQQNMKAIFGNGDLDEKSVNFLVAALEKKKAMHLMQQAEAEVAAQQRAHRRKTPTWHAGDVSAATSPAER